jgi:hypothetical protein
MAGPAACDGPRYFIVFYRDDTASRSNMGGGNYRAGLVPPGTHAYSHYDTTKHTREQGGCTEMFSASILKIGSTDCIALTQKKRFARTHARVGEA